MHFIHQLTRSFVVLGLLAFALVVGFSGIALADEKAAETKASGEMKAAGDGEMKAAGDGEKKAAGDGEKKAAGDGEKKAAGDGEKKAEGEKKADETK